MRNYRWLFVICWALTPCWLSAQQDLYVDGQLLAHDVSHTTTMPEALQELLRGRKLTALGAARNTKRKARCQQLSDTQKRKIEPVGPLLKSIRDQKAPYNNLCPQWIDDEGNVSEERCLSGCVATCIEQVIAYYRYPEALLDTLHGWEDEHYVIEDMLPGTRFEWDNYLYDYRDGWTAEQGHAIALTTLAVGTAVHMDYGLTASSTSIWNAIEPLKSAFGYGTVRCHERLLYPSERWHRLLQNELQNGRPIIYSGFSMEIAGHAFNIDGVDAQGFYHVNWGYNGNYDGWFDLDWLDPWEPTDMTPDGIAEGLFCNHTALLISPQAEVEVLDGDSLDINNLHINLKRVEFLREPDTNGYIPADFYFENTGDDEVTYTFEVMTNQPTDTALFEQADFVGLSGIRIPAKSESRQRVYLHFSEIGERILGISHDDETIPFTMPVTIEIGVTPKLEWGQTTAEVTLNEDRSTCSATMSLNIANKAASGYAGDVVTYCLYEDGKEKEDTRHYEVLMLKGGEEQTSKVTFNGLKPATHYTFLARCPWPVKSQIDFWTPNATLLEEMRDGNDNPQTGEWYHLNGVPADASARGLVIGQQRKRIQ